MSTLGVFNVKGSPGATSLAVALAAHGFGQGAVLIEADAAGGDLALRYGIPQNPGLAALAARSLQAAAGRDVLDGLTRTVEADGTGPVELVPAPVEPAAVTAALTALAARPHAQAAAWQNRPVLLDLGRLDPQGPGHALAAACDVAVLAVRGDAVCLGHAREAEWITHLPGRVGFVLVDTGPYRAPEAARVLGIPCLGQVPMTRKPLRGRGAAKAVRALWSELTVPARETATAPDLVEVSRR